VKIGLELLIKKARVVIQTEDAALAGSGEEARPRAVGPISQPMETDYSSLAAREASHAEIVAKAPAAGAPPAGIVLSASPTPAGPPRAGTHWRAP